LPSERILNQKKEVVKNLVEKLQKASSGILVDYRGLTVEQDTELRNKLRESEVEYKVVKNNLTRFAIKETGLDQLDSFLKGPTSVALSYADPVFPAKVLVEFAKKNDALEIKAGFVDGKIINIEEIKSLATLPSKEELIAKVLGGLNSPIAGFVNVLNGNMRGLVVALNAIGEQKEQQA
jgi:large subunit ribosomal protein L10